MDFNQFFSFLVATIVGLGLAVTTMLIARKSGLGNVQKELIDTLRDTASALSQRVDFLEGELKRLQNLLDAAILDTARLRQALIDTVAENSELRKKFSLPERPT